MPRRGVKKQPMSRHTLRHHLIPTVVWLAAVTGVIGLFGHQTKQVQVLGIARGTRHRVAATCTGRIRQIDVQLFDTVEKGQPLVTIDTLTDDQRIRNQYQAKELEAERETLRTNIDFLQAQRLIREEQLVDQMVRTQADHAGNERIFSVGVETARMQVLDLERQLANERATHAQGKDEVATLRHLVEESAVSSFELQQAQQRQQRLEQMIAQYEQIQSEAQQNLDEAIQRQQAFLELPDSPLTTNAGNVASFAQRMRRVADMEIATHVQRAEEIEQRLKNLNQAHIVQLKAPFDGTVSQLPLGPGEVVDVNTAVLQLTGTAPTEVVAYISTDQVDRIRPGMTVEVVKNSHPVKFVKNCEIIAVGPAIEQLPAQLWINPSIPQWGRAFLISVPAELQLLTGEKVGIRRL
ncbi:HlyD family secretion protein [Planctomycetota bacterium]